MDIKAYAALLMAALRELDQAVTELCRETMPHTPLPRPHIFELWPGVSWPAIEEGRPRYDYLSERRSERRYTRYVEYYPPEEIIKMCGGQPRQILRVLRKIQAAAAWCRARAEGRRRMAEEILRQQRRAVEVLEAESALQALR
jgi:hypothetical protein